MHVLARPPSQHFSHTCLSSRLCFRATICPSSRHAFRAKTCPSKSQHRSQLRALGVNKFEDRILSIKISLAKSSGSLDLGWLGLDEIPEDIFELNELEELVLAGNRLQSIPDDIAKLKSLKKLQLAGNQISSLPFVFTTMTHLQEVWFHGNLLDQLPEDIGELSNLEKLSLSGNRLQRLPESLSRLTKLKELSVSGNLLQELPHGLGSLGELQTLSANGNHLVRVAPEIGQCQALRNLQLQTNKLVEVPEEVFKLRSLEELNLSDNAIESLPQDWQLDNCKEIWLYGNQLKQLPASLWTLPRLECLWLEGNPLDQNPLQLALDSLSTYDCALREIGLEEDKVREEKLPLHVRSRLRLGISHANGLGYLKVQPAGDRLGNSTEDATQSQRPKLVIVTFASAPGIPNWGGVLSKVAAQASPEEKCFDVFFVCDGGRNWYSGGDKGALYWRQRIEAVTKLYDKVLMLGDSMGGTGALLFADLATSVQVFTPQVKLSEASMRPGHGQRWLDRVTENVIANVASSQATIHCHCGSWDHDLRQAKLLPEEKCELIIHDVDSHRLAITLNRHRRLLPIIRTAILKELGLYEPAKLVNLL